jgi:hypothetical protein
MRNDIIDLINLEVAGDGEVPLGGGEDRNHLRVQENQLLIQHYLSLTGSWDGVRFIASLCGEP